MKFSAYSTIFLGLFALPLLAEEGPPVLRDRWDVAYVGTDRIGYLHAISWRLESAGKTIVQTRQASRLTVQRFGQPMTVQSFADFFELEDGRLYAFDASTKISTETTRSSGRLTGPGKFQIVVEMKGQKTQQTIDWPADVLGPYALDLGLRSPPPKSGDVRASRTFLTELNSLAVRTITIGEQEDTNLLGKDERLFRVAETISQAPAEIKSTLWVDAQGEVRKSALPVGDLLMTTYATTKDDALAKVAKGTVDLGYQTLVKPDRAIPNAHSASGVTYRLLLGDKVAADTIPQARYQKVVRTSDNEIELRVERAIPQGDHASSTPEPGAEFLEENTYLQPNHPAIQKVAHEVTKDEPNPWSRAVKLCEWVDEHMSNADFSVGLAPSSEVIETKRGDCTEHAILLAALARAAKIPSRVAMGLVYLEGTQSFGYHMWTEVYVDGDWFPLDGTLGTNGIGGGHIKIADASLKGVDANSAFLPIFKIIGKLKIQVEKVDA